MSQFGWLTVTMFRYGLKVIMKSTTLCIALTALTLAFCVGCGSGETIMPEGELTAEQLEKVQQEDDLTEDEEGGGGL